MNTTKNIQNYLTDLSSGVRAKYSRSIKPSIRFLIITGEGKNRTRS